MQNVEIVVKIARFHLSLVMTNQFIVTIASKTINQKEATVVEADLVETVVVEDLVEADVEQEDMAEIAAVVEDLEEIDHHEKCTKWHVEIVAMSVKYHSNQKTLDQSIVMIASRTTNQKETIVDAINHF